MSALSTISRGVKHAVKGHDLGLGHGANVAVGLAGWGLNAGVAVGAGYAMGLGYSQWRGHWYGDHLPKIAAGLGKIGSGLMQAFTGGPSLVSGVVDSVGQSGLTMMACEWGLEHGRKKAGYQVGKFTSLPANAERVDRIAGLPPSPSGEALDWPAVFQLADMH